MRAPDGKIVLHQEKLAEIYRSKVAKIPFLRGVILLWDALGLGMRALTISANTQTGEEEKLEGPALYVTLGFALVFGIGFSSCCRQDSAVSPRSTWAGMSGGATWRRD